MEVTKFGGLPVLTMIITQWQQRNLSRTLRTTRLGGLPVMTPVPPMLEAYATESRRKFRVTCSHVDDDIDEDAFDSISTQHKHVELPLNFLIFAVRSHCYGLQTLTNAKWKGYPHIICSPWSTFSLLQFLVTIGGADGQWDCIYNGHLGEKWLILLLSCWS